MHKNKFSLFQLFTLMISIIIGSGILNLSASLAKTIKQDAWMIPFLGGFAIIVAMNLGLSICKQYPKKNILEISITLLGPIFGRLVNSLWIIHLYVTTIVALRISMDFISAWILPNTPIEIMTITFLLSTVYLARCGLSPLVRFAEITAILLFPFILILFIPFHEWNFLYILPTFQQPLTKYFSASLSAMFSFLGFEVLFFVFNLIDADYKKIRFTANIAILFVTIAYFLITLTSLLTFGAEGLINEIYASIKYIQLISFPVIERVEFAVAFFWIFALFSTCSIEYFFSYFSLKNTLPIKSDLWLIPFTIPIYFLFLLPKNIVEVNILAEYAGIGSIISEVFILSVLKIVSLFKKAN